MTCIEFHRYASSDDRVRHGPMSADGLVKIGMLASK